MLTVLRDALENSVEEISGTTGREAYELSPIVFSRLNAIFLSTDNGFKVGEAVLKYKAAYRSLYLEIQKDETDSPSTEKR
jgi:hypothetical protein